MHIESETSYKFYLFASITEAVDLDSPIQFLYYNQQLESTWETKQSLTNLSETELSF